MSESKRYEAFDIMRGLLAICVVFGHSIQQFPVGLGAWAAQANTFLYCFHMPAFVFVSGLCSYRMCRLRGYSEKSDYLKSRAVRLLVPYVSWALIYVVLRLVAGDCARMEYDYSKWYLFFFGYNPDGAMWFLWALFFATVLAVGIARPFMVARRFFAMGLVLLFCWWFQPWRHVVPTSVNFILLYAFFLVMGAYVRSHIEKIQTVKRQVAMLLAGSIVFTFAYSAKIWHLAHGFPCYVITSIAACFVLLVLSIWIARANGMIMRGLVLLGHEAMTIYVLGEPIKVASRLLFKRLGLPVGVSFSVMILIVLVLPVLLSKFVRKSRIAALLLLGERGAIL